MAEAVTALLTLRTNFTPLPSQPIVFPETSGGTGATYPGGSGGVGVTTGVIVPWAGLGVELAVGVTPGGVGVSLGSGFGVGGGGAYSDFPAPPQPELTVLDPGNQSARGNRR